MKPLFPIFWIEILIRKSHLKRWAFVCLIIDLSNREMIGLSVGWYKTAELVKLALQSIPYALDLSLRQRQGVRQSTH